MQIPFGASLIIIKMKIEENPHGVGVNKGQA
jgi:hypothetical protein